MLLECTTPFISAPSAFSLSLYIYTYMAAYPKSSYIGIPRTHLLEA